jgi:hypothetical protein
MRSTLARALVGAGLLFVVSLPALAAGVNKISSGDLPSLSAIRASTQAHIAPTGATPSEIIANQNRAYPPSCLQAPLLPGLLPGKYANDPARVSNTITLSGDAYGASTAEQQYLESDTVTVFRIPCSGGTSALLLEIDRPSNLDGDTSVYPVYPAVYVKVDLSGVETPIALRTPKDPNTYLSDNVAGTPLYDSSVFVIENTYLSDLQFDFNPAFALFVYNLLPTTNSNTDTEEFDIPAYNPALYPAASQALPISGYLTGTWYDSTHSGEGIQTEVGEVGTAGTQRFVSVSWYTYDLTGTPYWLIGSGVVTLDPTTFVAPNTVSVTLPYTTNGGFAGDFGSSATKALWGTMQVSFPDCNTMVFTYDTTGTGIPSTVPTGTGTRTWKRFTTVNGLTCQ